MCESRVHGTGLRCDLASTCSSPLSAKEKPMLLVHRWAVVLVLLALAGCTVDTTEPLSDPVTAAPDVSLYGHWVRKDATSEIHAYIRKHTTKDYPNSIMEIVKITRNTDDKQIEAGPTGYFTVSRVGNTSYMNRLAEKGDSKLS